MAAYRYLCKRSIISIASNSQGFTCQHKLLGLISARVFFVEFMAGFARHKLYLRGKHANFVHPAAECDVMIYLETTDMRRCDMVKLFASKKKYWG